MRALEQMPGVHDVAVFGGGLHVGLSGNKEDADSGMAAIRARLADRNIHVNRLETITPSLEDVFVAMIEAEERMPAP
jgi:ABC-2 type transport system ATP-binding protein